MTSSLLSRLGDEGLRLFFPLAALHGALWPLLWSVGGGLTLPFSHSLSPSLWHGSELLLGTFGAALLGFLTTAIPEWTDTPRLRGRPLLGLALLWLIGRLAGAVGSSPLGWVSGLADLGWMLLLTAYVLHRWWTHPLRLRALVPWLLALTTTAAFLRWGLACTDEDLTRRALWLLALLYLGLLGLILARITIPVTNLCLDPTETSTPFRPHPGRLSLAPGLVAVTSAASLAGASEAVCAFLLIAAGAAFVDRAGEAFVGPELARAEIWGLAVSSILAGAGLALVGMAGLGAGIGPAVGLHVAMIGGLGLAVLMVFAIAGLFHTGRSLPFPRPVPALLLLVIAAAALRVLPDIGLIPPLPGPPHGLAALLWAAGLLGWLWIYGPFLVAPARGDDGCD